MRCRFGCRFQYLGFCVKSWTGLCHIRFFFLLPDSIKVLIFMIAIRQLSCFSITIDYLSNVLELSSLEYKMPHYVGIAKFSLSAWTDEPINSLNAE